jgi:hypothetical protein
LLSSRVLEVKGWINGYKIKYELSIWMRVLEKL